MVVGQEYIAICSQVGVPEDEALQLLRSLHRVGAVLHFHDHPTLCNHVFLHPNYVVDAVFSSFGLKGPTEAYTDKLVGGGGVGWGEIGAGVALGTGWHGRTAVVIVSSFCSALQRAAKTAQLDIALKHLNEKQATRRVIVANAEKWARAVRCCLVGLSCTYYASLGRRQTPSPHSLSIRSL